MTTLRLIVECIGWLVCFGGGLALASWFAVQLVQYAIVNLPLLQVSLAWAGSVFGKAFGTAYRLAAGRLPIEPPPLKPDPWSHTIDPNSAAVRGGAETAEFKPHDCN